MENYVFPCIFIENMKNQHIWLWGITNYYPLEMEFHQKSSDLGFSDRAKKMTKSQLITLKNKKVTDVLKNPKYPRDISESLGGNGFAL